MAGVYATIFPVSPWIAIITLVLCSLLLFLMDKRIVMAYLVPFGRSLLLYGQKISRHVREPELIVDSLKNLHGRHMLVSNPL